MVFRGGLAAAQEQLTPRSCPGLVVPAEEPEGGFG